MDNQLASLQRQVARLRAACIVGAVGVAALAAFGFAPRGGAEVIRVRGIVVEDEAGRDRILIGVPVPESTDRFRTDAARVREGWAPRLGGEKYMESYAALDHSAGGIVFLNEQGYDKLVFGEKMPDPNTGKRLVQAAGLTFNDDEGFERGGLGVSSVPEGGTRVVLGMDDPSVGEAMHLFVLEDGTKGMQIAYEGGRILLGRSHAGGWAFGTPEEFSGIRIVDDEGVVLWEHNALRAAEPEQE